MNKLIKFLTFALAILFFISCGQQEPSDEEFRESLSEINQEMQNASDLIDEALNAESTKEIIAKGDEALNLTEIQLDAYMDETDRAARRIYKETRNDIIDIKQIIVEIDFRVDLLESTEKYNIEQTEVSDETRNINRTRPVGYQFPHIITQDEKVIKERLQYGEKVKQNLRDNLNELKTKINKFKEENL